MSRAVVVTGGTGALGHAVVAHLLAHGHRVAVPYRDAKSWDELRRTLAVGDALWGEPAELDSAGAGQFMDAAAAWAGGHLDGLATIAGGYESSGTIEVAPEAEWERMIRINLGTAFAACRAALPHLLKKGGGIVTVSSRTASSGGEGAVAYAVSKAGVEALTRGVAQENRRRGVRANAVAPGTLDTEANRRAMPGADRQAWVAPSAVAEVIGFLLSPASAPLTGTILPL